MVGMTDAQGLSDEEMLTLVSLLRRYVAHDMDQWENWRFATEYGDVFVSISRKPALGADPVHRRDLCAGPGGEDPVRPRAYDDLDA